jgi:hypothetical protein
MEDPGVAALVYEYLKVKAGKVANVFKQELNPVRIPTTMTPRLGVNII